MSSKHEIKSEKILVKDIFSNLWFRVPEYQRPYVWGDDQIDDLLDDLAFALREKPEQDYFLGSFVYQLKRAGIAAGEGCCREVRSWCCIGVGVSQIHPARHWCLLFYPTSCWKRKVRHRGQLQYQPG